MGLYPWLFVAVAKQFVQANRGDGCCNGMILCSRTCMYSTRK